MGSHKFLFVGDIVLETKPAFHTDVQALFEESVICSCNFEAPLQGVGTPIAKTGPHVHQHASAPAWLQDRGFTLFSLANNHINDYGAEALAATMDAFAPSTLLGAGHEEQAYALNVQLIDGFRYGFLAYGENGYGAIDGHRTFGHAWVNHPRVDGDIARYRAEVDFLVVQVHAGVEMLEVPIPEWRQRYRQLLECGADVIVGHHPHVIQGMEMHLGKPIFYSLGNFYFDYPASHPQWNSGGILQLEVEEGRLKGFSRSVIQKQETNLLLMDAQHAASVYATLDAQLHADDYIDYVNRAAVADWHRAYKQYYAKPFNGLSTYSLKAILKQIKRFFFNRKIDYNMIWHNMFIESNHWFVSRAIQTMVNRKAK